MFERRDLSAHAPSAHDAWRHSAVASLHPRQVMLVTDFDGTLAEIAPDPTEARILPATVAALSRLAGLISRVAVLSSRPTSDLVRMVPVSGIDLIGDSGLVDLTSDERQRLDRFNVKAAQLLSGTPGVWLEIKPGATAIHYRHAQVGAAEILRALEPLLQSSGLFVQPGRRVVEVIPRLQPKGAALARLIERRRPHGVVCLGDDENDRPMFDYLAGQTLPHLTVGVASDEARADLFAACDLVMSGPAEVSRFLMMLSEWATGYRPG
ncbi:MAG TPA: trehalose-phosphatase [Candidatus Dormibacteraeota bacterium]|nr:trehalose-phosphatase [Candidatus Dormibacteraeota bacterium]